MTRYKDKTTKPVGKPKPQGKPPGKAIGKPMGKSTKPVKGPVKGATLPKPVTNPKPVAKVITPPSKPKRLTLATLKEKVHALWAKYGILLAGSTYSASGHLTSALTPVLKALGYKLYVHDLDKDESESYDYSLQYVLTKGQRPSGKTWVRMVELGGIVNPDDFTQLADNPEAELWARAVKQNVITMAEVPTNQLLDVQRIINPLPNPPDVAQEPQQRPQEQPRLDELLPGEEFLLGKPETCTAPLVTIETIPEKVTISEKTPGSISDQVTLEPLSRTVTPAEGTPAVVTPGSEIPTSPGIGEPESGKPRELNLEEQV
jgi:hypothetical protein